jgi:hypothetical protein
MDEREEDRLEAEGQARIADACLGKEPIADGRLGLYRRLIQGNLAAVARRLLPRTARALDERGLESFDGWVRRFLAEAAPTTPYLRDVPGELVRWATPLWRSDPTVPSFVPDLAQLEITLFQIEAALRDETEASRVTEVALDRPLVFTTPRSLVSFDYAVDEVGSEPAKRVTHLLIHRDADNTTHTTRLDADRASLLARLFDGAPLGVAIAQAAIDNAAPLDDAGVRDIAQWLADLGASGALLGGRA